MGDYFLGELRIFGFDWAPQDWALCNGTNLPFSQNAALGSLLGITFGGVSGQNFNLPDLRGRSPLGSSTSSVKPPGVVSIYNNGNTGGAETVAVTAAQTPAHTHAFNASTSPAASAALRQSIFADVAGTNPTYFTGTGTTAPLDPASITGTGSGGGHANMQPFLVLNYCICTAGIYPARN